MKKLLIVAGEASADLYASRILEELRRGLPGLRAFGVGGTLLKAHGFEAVIKAEELSIVGGADWFDKVGHVYRKFNELLAVIDREQPDLALLLDLPDFNLRLARQLRRRGIRVFYFISPQVWAWRRYRVRRIRRDVDKMMVVFPFEEDFYRRRGFGAEFVGHPLMDFLTPREHYRTQAEIEAAPRIAILPGSRESEIRMHWEVLKTAADGIWLRFPGAEFRAPVASTLSASALDRAFQSSKIQVVEDSSWDVLKWADIALVASGTATLETALIGTPQCIFYRLHPTTAFIVRHIIRYRSFLGMPNVLARKEIAREYILHKATAENLLGEATNLIRNGNYRLKMVRDFQTCRAMLREGGAIERVAGHVATALEN